MHLQCRAGRQHSVGAGTGLRCTATRATCDNLRALPNRGSNIPHERMQQAASHASPNGAAGGALALTLGSSGRNSCQMLPRAAASSAVSPAACSQPHLVGMGMPGRGSDAHRPCLDKQIWCTAVSAAPGPPPLLTRGPAPALVDKQHPPLLHLGDPPRQAAHHQRLVRRRTALEQRLEGGKVAGRRRRRLCGGGHLLLHYWRLHGRVGWGLIAESSAHPAASSNACTCSASCAQQVQGAHQVQAKPLKTACPNDARAPPRPPPLSQALAQGWCQHWTRFWLHRAEKRAARGPAQNCKGGTGRKCSSEVTAALAPRQCASSCCSAAGTQSALPLTACRRTGPTSPPAPRRRRTGCLARRPQLLPSTCGITVMFLSYITTQRATAVAAPASERAAAAYCGSSASASSKTSRPGWSTSRRQCRSPAPTSSSAVIPCAAGGGASASRRWGWHQTRQRQL